MKIIITGCAGFIGNHLARKLLNDGHTIIGIDNFSLGFDKNIIDLKKNFYNTFSFFEKDIRYMDNHDSAFDKYCADTQVVYHLAGQTELYFCQEKPYEAIDINIKGTVQVLNWSKRIDVQHFIFMDTSAEYDNLLLTTINLLNNEEIEKFNYYPNKERYAPSINTPVGFYSITKMAAAQFVRSWTHYEKRRSTIIRPFNVYGPSININRDIPPVIGAFAKKLLLKQKPIIFGDGSKSRDFIYVDDAIDLLVKVLTQHNFVMNGETRDDSQTFNMGTGKTYSVKEILYFVDQEINERTKDSSKLEIDWQPNKEHETQITLADITNTSSYFDWKPKIEIKEGISKTVRSIAKELGVKY